MVMAMMERQRYMLAFRAAQAAKIDTGLRLVGRPHQHRITKTVNTARFDTIRVGATGRW